MPQMDNLVLPVCVAAAVALIAGYFYLEKKKKNGDDFLQKKPTTPGRPPKSPKKPVATCPILKIYFGSQTGTAESFAGKLVDEALKLSFDASAIDLEDYDEDVLTQDELAIFIVATYGEGDPTDNAVNCVKWINEMAEEGCLSKMKFAVFGLGNRQYEKYQAMGKLFDSRLEALGGKRIFERGEGDDDGTLEEDFDAWKERFWPVLLESCSMASSVDLDSAPYEYKYKLKEYDNVGAAGPFSTSSSIDKESLHEVPIKVNKELHSAHSKRSCRHIEIDISNTQLKYETGDHFAVAPVNDADEVAALASRVGATNLDAVVSLLDSKSVAPFPCPCTTRDALSRYVDINAVPSKMVLKAFGAAATNSDEAQRLHKMGTKAGKDEYESHVAQKHRTVLELLQEFSSINVSIGQLLELLPRLQPRYYSISSSSSMHPKTVHITEALVVGPKPDGRVFKGVCTHYLQTLTGPNAKCLGFVRRSTFKLPTNPKAPVIMVGPGTGLAPFRGFIQEFQHRKEHKQPIGDARLYFGCQNRTHDFIYESELLAAAETGILSDLQLAFSRELEHKVYVQHKIAETSATIYDLLANKGAYVYVCGATSMAKDVKNEIVKAIQAHGKQTPEQAEEFVSKLTNENRYQQDVWS